MLRYCFLTVALGLAFSSLPAQAAILLSDNFDNVVNGGTINNRVPTVNTVNSNTWSTATSTFLGNGAGGLSVNSGINSGFSGGIDLGANYFANNPGVYTLSLTITQPTSTALSWIGLGFAQTNTVGDNMVGNSGSPWLLFRLNGSVNVYGGAGTSNQLTNGGIAGAASLSATRDIAHVFTLTLDTTVANWTVNAAIDGVPADVNGSAAGLAYTFATNPTAIRYASISAGYNTATGTGTIDDFSLSVAAIPEPSSVLFAAAGLGVIAWRTSRRRV